MTEDIDSAGLTQIDLRRRRVAYRANHRGTKEMDWLVGRYADAHLDELVDPALDEFERFLELPDPQLQQWLLEPLHPAAGEFANLIDRIRSFHGLTASADRG